MSTQLQSGPVHSDERPLCVEPGCDRDPAPHDARCILHAQRLGSMPREESALPTILAPEQSGVTEAEPQQLSTQSDRWSKLAPSSLISSLITYGTAASFAMNWVPRDLGMLVAGLLFASTISSAVLGWKQLREADDGTQTILGVILLFIGCVPATGLALFAALLLFNFIF